VIVIWVPAVPVVGDTLITVGQPGMALELEPELFELELEPELELLEPELPEVPLLLEALDEVAPPLDAFEHKQYSWFASQAAGAEQ
jgi:hypothetical protein